MSAVLHPTGPETPRTYWIRRAAVLAAVLLVVLVVLWAFRPADGDVRAVPGPVPSTPADPRGPAGSPSPSAEAGSSQSAGASPAARSTGPSPRESGAEEDADADETDSDADETDSDADETDADDGSDGSGSEDGSGGTDSDSGQTRSDSGSGETSSEGGTGSPEPDQADPDAAGETGTPEPEPVLCRGTDVRVGLDGSSRPETGQPHELEVSLTNGSAEPCDLVLDESTVELRVFSGTDRIWTTEHCADWLAVAEEDRRLTLDPDQTHAWTLDWPVQRSAEDCELLEQTLGEGTYVATALHRDSEPAQLVMVLG